MAAASSTAIVPQILDGEDDYKDWSVRVKTYLLSKDLWDVVESEPPEQEGVGDFKAWRKNNAEALHAIQLSCGPRTFHSIRDKANAKAAWDTLETLFNREKRKLLSMAAAINPVENTVDYGPLFDAVSSDDCCKAKEFLTQHPPSAITATKWALRALSMAIYKGRQQIVEELVQLMTEEQLETKIDSDETALTIAAATNIKIVECLVARNKKLLGIAKDSSQMTPIVIAAKKHRWDIVRYLYSVTPLEDLKPDKGIAWDLLGQCPSLSCTQGLTSCPIYEYALLPSAFPSGTSLKFWQRWIYKCIHVKHAPSVGDARINVQNQENEQGDQGNSTGINHIRKMKLQHDWSREILGSIKDSNIKEMTAHHGIVDTVLRAVQNGIVELVITLCKAKPELLDKELGRNRKYIFHHAVECRQEKVYSLIYRTDKRYYLATLKDDSGNSMLHYAATLSPLEKLDGISGAALQMQRERQWYKVRIILYIFVGLLTSMIPEIQSEYLTSQNSNGNSGSCTSLTKILD
ncbi:hypothetical protein DVH24_037282 [Malus domestica]|uniref:Uncharacterized protein n=1 Tax=Malus domestica TaxID=3750 RepID=A0A498HDG2_MALDO|nr:hypothetical protein DVH24_037282 [Malus domestica]